MCLVADTVNFAAVCSVFSAEKKPTITKFSQTFFALLIEKVLSLSASRR